MRQWIVFIQHVQGILLLRQYRLKAVFTILIVCVQHAQEIMLFMLHRLKAEATIITVFIIREKVFQMIRQG